MKPPQRAPQGPLHGEELRRHLVVMVRGRLIGDGDEPTVQLVERGGDGRQLGERGGHGTMMTYRGPR